MADNDFIITPAYGLPIAENNGATQELQTWMTQVSERLNANDASLLNFSNVPTTDPLIAGQLWIDVDTLKVSQG